MKKEQILTKSNYLNALQCPKCLWMAIHKRDTLPKPTEMALFRMKEGQAVGELAKKLFPDGIDLPERDFENNIGETKKSLTLGKPLFEAGFLADNLYSRVDILNPVGNGEWDIIEVKSSSRIKEVNLHDISFQMHCCTKAGIKVRKCILMHINTRYVRNGEIEYSELFALDDVSSEVNKVIEDIDERIKDAFDIIGSDNPPKVSIGSHCNSPYGCGVSECWEFLPNNNVTDLYRGGKKSFELIEGGIITIKEIPESIPLNAKQDIQRECERTGNPHVDNVGIRKFLDSLECPLHFMDFETFSTAVPMFDGLKPYQAVPFQWSLHILDSKNSEPKHLSFLASGKSDPRKEFISTLKDSIGKSGSVVVYNQSFESRILKGLSEAFPKDRQWTESVISRMADLLIPFRNFYYYNPKQKGSASLKRVLPAITGKGYDNLEINNGDDASLTFINILRGKTSKKDEPVIRKQLEKYCGLDTEGLIWIIRELEKIVK